MVDKYPSPFLKPIMVEVGFKNVGKNPEGQFVTEYVGEVIMSSDVDGRFKKIHQNGIVITMFALDFNSRDDYPYTVDGTWLGNESHLSTILANRT